MPTIGTSWLQCGILIARKQIWNLLSQSECSREFLLYRPTNFRPLAARCIPHRRTSLATPCTGYKRHRLFVDWGIKKQFRKNPSQSRQSPTVYFLTLCEPLRLVNSIINASAVSRTARCWRCCIWLKKRRLTFKEVLCTDNRVVCTKMIRHCLKYEMSILATTRSEVTSLN